MDSRNFVIQIFTAETCLPETIVYFIGCCIRMSNASYPPRGFSDRFNPEEELCDNDEGFTAAGARYETHVPGFTNCSTLLIR
jgi:hypothetical protein